MNQIQKKFRPVFVRKKSRILNNSIAFPKNYKTPTAIGMTLVILYLIRVSVFSLLAGGVSPLITSGGRVALGLGGVFLITKGVNKLSTSGIILIFLTLPGVLLSNLPSQSFIKWAGWVLLFIVVGPIIQSKHARTLRQAAWKSFRLMFIVISVLSFAWYVLHLPNLGRGAFTGITLHSMLLGPIAGMTFLFCFLSAMINRSYIYVILALTAIIPCLLAGSRTAVLALVIGFIVLVGFYIARTNLKSSIPLITIALLLILLGVFFTEEVKKSNSFYAYTVTLQEKGLQNTRKALWVARLEEFKQNIFFGMGVGMATTVGAKFDSSGKINVEPGSSYLVLLSMTGLLGAVAFSFVLISIFHNLYISKFINKYDPRLIEGLIISSFLSIHMITEGYIFAVGSPFCLLMWLCLGRINDLVTFPSNPATLKTRSATLSRNPIKRKFATPT